jgi:hypothetical protein
MYAGGVHELPEQVKDPPLYENAGTPALAGVHPCTDEAIQPESPPLAIQHLPEDAQLKTVYQYEATPCVAQPAAQRLI